MSSNLPPGCSAADFDPLYSGQVGCDLCFSDAFSENEYLQRKSGMVLALLICDECAEKIKEEEETDEVLDFAGLVVFLLTLAAIGAL